MRPVWPFFHLFFSFLTVDSDIFLVQFCAVLRELIPCDGLRFLGFFFLYFVDELNGNQLIMNRVFCEEE